MTQAFFWTVVLVLAMIVLLETASASRRGTPLHRLSLVGLVCLVGGVILVTVRMMLVHQIPSFSLAPPTFFLSFPS